jgi:hypothetical protein
MRLFPTVASLLTLAARRPQQPMLESVFWLADWARLGWWLIRILPVAALL